jgi:hypothetical protein
LPQLSDIMPGIGATLGAGPAAGWLLHFAGGALFGVLLAWLDPDLPGDSLRQRGVVLAALAWLPSMFFIMPLAGLGVFAMNAGILTMLALLALYLFFGGVTGSFYGWFLLQSAPLRYREVYADTRHARVVLKDGDFERGYEEATLVPETAAREAGVEKPSPESKLRMPRTERLLRLVPKEEAPRSAAETDQTHVTREKRSRQWRS